jgi:hypothetical protein
MTSNSGRCKISTAFKPPTVQLVVRLVKKEKAMSENKLARIKSNDYIIINVVEFTGNRGHY